VIALLDPPVITIDGPSGSGKGTIARKVANALDFHLLDSGALYRLVAIAAKKNGIALTDCDALALLARDLDVRFDSNNKLSEKVFMDDIDVTLEVRKESTGAQASIVAGLTEVRLALLGRQRAFQVPPGLVADGRDMGTNVFPSAAIKVFLTAGAEVRAKRRHKQLKDQGVDVNLAALLRDIKGRDERDSSRLVAPLKPAKNARILDSSELSIETVTNTVLEWVAEL
jgi:cytidylate kinase